MRFLESELWLSVGSTVAKLGAILVVSYAIVRIGNSLIGRIFASPAEKSRPIAIDENRAKTLSGLLKNALRYAMGIIALFMVLDLFGIDTKALLGGAAVLGLTISFGAQNLVRDVISGFFLIYERQYDVGEYVNIAGVSGVVEQVGLRTTVLRDWSGDVHTVPNGLIDKTTNCSRSASRALVEVTVPYSQDLGKVAQVMQGVCDAAKSELESIVEGPRVLGVSKLGESGATFMIWAKTEPLSHWGVERYLRLKLKEALDAASIEISYPRVVVDIKGPEQPRPLG
ncbi:MAG TPA: mechanosensitive ion channel family protein [Bacillota bacterium]|nr:mechanosensitive ion channel family protein [Bacillota bacterium]